MKQLKYIICAFLLALTFISAKAGDYYGNPFTPCYKITVDGSAVANEFYVTKIFGMSDLLRKAGDSTYNNVSSINCN